MSNKILEKYKAKTQIREEQVKESTTKTDYTNINLSKNQKKDNEKYVTVNVRESTRNKLKKFSVLNDKKIREVFEEAIEDLFSKYNFKD